MKTIIIALTIICSQLTLNAQNRRSPNKAKFLKNNLNIFAVQKIDKVHYSGYLENTEGGYYLNKKWNKCNIKSKDNQELYLPCNYNLHKDQFEMKLNNELYFLKDENIKTITINKKSYFPLNKAQPKNEHSTYYELIATGKNVNLIKLFKLKLNSTQSTNSLGTFKQKITIKETLFFQFNDGRVIKVPNSKSKLFSLLEIDKTLKDKYKKINLKNTSNLSKLISNI